MRLRAETDAPMMDCKKALVESDGDFDAAKKLLREKGKAAAAKKAGRSTKEGIAFVVVDGSKAAGIVVECETDFVAKNEDFIKLVQGLGNSVLSAASPAAGEVVELGQDDEIDGKTLKGHAEDAVATIRENIRIARAVCMQASAGASYSIYNHTNTNKAAAIIEMKGDAGNLDEVGFQMALQVVAFPPQFLTRDEVPQDVIASEIETETNRAIKEGKPAEIAAKIAQGRVNKEYYQSQVLLEQPFWTDAKKKVKDFVKETATGGSAEVSGYTLLRVGDGPQED